MEVEVAVVVVQREDHVWRIWKKKPWMEVEVRKEERENGRWGLELRNECKCCPKMRFFTFLFVFLGKSIYKFKMTITCHPMNNNSVLLKKLKNN